MIAVFCHSFTLDMRNGVRPVRTMDLRCIQSGEEVTSRSQFRKRQWLCADPHLANSYRHCSKCSKWTETKQYGVESSGEVFVISCVLVAICVY